VSDTANASSTANNYVTYTVRTQGPTYYNDAIEASLISDIIWDFETEYNDFIVVEPNVPIEACAYMQAIPAHDDQNSVIVELRLEYDDASFKHYSYQTTDKEEVIRMFLDYWGSQKLPEWTSWTDITDQF
jgi:hypothetical protein